MAHDLKNEIEEYLYKGGEFNPLSYSGSYIDKHLNLEGFGLQAFTTDKEGIKLYKVFVHFCLCICGEDYDNSLQPNNTKKEYVDKWVNTELAKHPIKEHPKLIKEFKRELRDKKFPKTDTKGYLREPLQNLYGYLQENEYTRADQIKLIRNTYKNLDMYVSDEAIRKERERALKRYTTL